MVYNVDVVIASNPITLDVEFNAAYIVESMTVNYSDEVEFLGIVLGVANTNTNTAGNYRIKVNASNELEILFKQNDGTWVMVGSWLPQPV